MGSAVERLVERLCNRFKVEGTELPENTGEKLIREMENGRHGWRGGLGATNAKVTFLKQKGHHQTAFSTKWWGSTKIMWLGGGKHDCRLVGRFPLLRLTYTLCREAAR